MAVLLRDRLLRPEGVAGLLIVSMIVSSGGCQSGPLIRGQSPSATAPPRLLATPPPETTQETPDVSEAAAAAIAAATSTAASKFPVTDVRIEGNDAISEPDIRRLLRVQAGRPVTEAQVRGDVRRLFGTRWFFSVEPIYRTDPKNPAGRQLVFRVVERPMIRAIRFDGNKRIDDKDLSEAIGLRAGSPFDISANREAVRKLETVYRDKGFPFAKVQLASGSRRSQRDVVFRIDEGQKVLVADVTFVGNEYGYATAGILKTKITTKRAFFGFDFFGGKFDPKTIPEDKKGLSDYYRGLGFFDVKITHKVLTGDVIYNPLRLGDANLTIEYTIDEGRQYTVRSITLRGNKVYSTKQLAADLELVQGEPFNQRHVATDARLIKEKYGRLGRLFARADPLTRFDDRAPGVVDVIYEIDEDRPYLIGPIDVHFHGDYPHTKETVVLNRLLFQPGELADPKVIRRSERRLAGMIFERGAQGPRIRVRPMEPEELVPKKIPADPLSGLIPRTRHDNSPGWRPGSSPEPPPRQIVKRRTQDATLWDSPRSLVQTSFQTLTDVLTGEPPVVRAQKPAIDPAARPYNPIYENSPLGDPFGSLGRALTDPNYGLLDIDVDVTEARTGRVMFGAGINSDSGLIGSIVLDENNFDLLRFPRSMQDVADGTAFRGGGQRFRIEAMPGYYFSRYLLNWSDPYFMDTDFSLSVAGFYYQRFFYDWDEHRTGGRVTLGRQLTREWSLAGTLRLEEVEIKNPDVPTPDLLAQALGDSWFTTGKVSLTHDTRDNAFLPTEGHYVQASYEQAFGDFTYPQLRGDAKQYFTLHERPDGEGRHVLSLSAQLGWTGDDTPIYERFFAGGYQSFRGFDFRGVTPRQAGFPGTGIGGQFMGLGSVQFQFPMTADEMISGVVFSDFGTIENEVAMDDFRLTLGAGLRVTIPAMGPVPIAVDWGIPVIQQDLDDKRVFSFYIGINR